MQGPSFTKRTITVKDIVADLEQGLTNEQLMEKYELSHDGLKKLFVIS
jgi:uncharacterized protein (DUF433 family)